MIIVGFSYCVLSCYVAISNYILGHLYCLTFIYSTNLFCTSAIYWVTARQGRNMVSKNRRNACFHGVDHLVVTKIII